MKNIIQRIERPIFLYFRYTRTERNGLLALMALTSLAMLIPTDWFWQNMPNQHDTIRANFAEKVATLGWQSGNSEAIYLKKEEITPQLFAFNPNLATEAELVQLGLQPRVARTMVNYRAKGGRFRQATDLKKVYGITNSDFERLLPFISLESTVPKMNDAEKYPPQYGRQNLANQAWNLQPFDPNTVSESTLMDMGFPQKIVTVLSNFKKNGGSFRQKEDLRKIYGLTEEIYFKIESYIQIADNQSKIYKNFNNEKLTVSSNKTTVANGGLDINKASEEDWVKVPKIGRTFAARITEYRNRLGGFVRLEQLKEVYGLSDSTYRDILPYCKIDPVSIHKLKINSITIADDCRHPYITREQLKMLVRYRINHGNYMNFETLSHAQVFTRENLLRLQPYISFE